MTVVINGTTGITNPNSMTIGNGGGSVATNTAVGASALAANTTGANNVAVGYQAGSNTTTGAITAVGSQVLRDNSTGVANTAIGGTYTGVSNAALIQNTTGSYNIAVGTGALQANTTASRNTAVGYQAGYTNSTSASNTIVGYQAGYSVTGASNVFVGDSAGYSASSGTINTFVGNGAGYSVTTGSKNTIIGGYSGNQGGLDIRTASNYIVLSDGDGNPRGIFDSSGNLLVGNTSSSNLWRGTAAANGVSISASEIDFQCSNNQMYITKASGYTDSTHISFWINGTQRGGITTTGTSTAFNTTSDYRLKENVKAMTGALAKVAALKPVTYTWKEDGSAGEGFIAHELADVCPLAVHGEKDAVYEDGSIKTQSIDTSFLVATLTAAIQELNAKVDAQAAEIAALKGQA